MVFQTLNLATGQVVEKFEMMFGARLELAISLYVKARKSLES